MEAALNVAGASLRFVRNVHCLLVRIVKVLRERRNSDSSGLRKALLQIRIIESRRLRKAVYFKFKSFCVIQNREDNCATGGGETEKGRLEEN